MEASFKILLIGKSGVGKTSIIEALTVKNFDCELTPTIGVDFKVKEIYLDEDKIKLGIWDTAGMEKFRVILPSLYRDIQGAILVYDISDKDSLQDLYSWVKEIHTYSNNQHFVGLVLGNKCDKPRVVPTEEGELFARRHRMMFMECSAKTLENIDYAFMELARKIYETPGLWKYNQEISNIKPLEQESSITSNCTSCYLCEYH